MNDEIDCKFKESWWEGRVMEVDGERKVIKVKITNHVAVPEEIYSFDSEVSVVTSLPFFTLLIPLWISPSQS